MHALLLAVAALGPVQQDQLEAVVAVSNGSISGAVRSALELKDFETLAEAAKRAGARAEHVPDANGAVVVVGDPFGLEARTRNVLATEEISRLANLGEPLKLSALSELGRTAILEWVSGQTAYMYGCEVASLEGAKVGIDIGYSATLSDGRRDFQTFIGEDREVLSEKSEIKLKPLESAAGKPHRLSAERQKAEIIERSTVQFSSPYGTTSIAARAKVMKVYLDGVEAQGRALYDRFVSACDALANQSGTVAKAGMRFDSLGPRERESISRNLADNFAKYGFRSPDEAAGFLARAKVKSADRLLQIGVMLRLPDGTIEGFSGSFRP
ncbi:MAG: hypothetical protein IT207_02605 [Fimbriimonadaceae bacterium]|nr:hypothetical protein [Fimbriimonadaceae bacterium]